MTNPIAVAFVALLGLGPCAGRAASQSPESQVLSALDMSAFGLAASATPSSFEALVIADDEPVFPGLQLMARLDKDVYQAGEPILLSVALENKSWQQVSLCEDILDLSQFTVIVLDNRSHVLPLSANGKQLLARQPEFTSSWSPEGELDSGQVWKYQFPLDRMYDMSRLTTYSVIIRRLIEVQERSLQVSNVFKIVNYQVISNRLTVKVLGGQP